MISGDGGRGILSRRRLGHLQPVSPNAGGSGRLVEPTMLGVRGRLDAAHSVSDTDRFTASHSGAADGRERHIIPGAGPPAPERTALVLQPIPRNRLSITTARKPKRNTNPTTTTTTSIVLGLLAVLLPTVSVPLFAG